MENHVFLPVQIAFLLRGLGAFGIWQKGRICGIVLNISFFDATEEGGHSLSPEKFTSQRRC